MFVGVVISIVSTMEGDGYALLLDAVTFEEIARVGFQRMYENAVLPLSSILKHDLSITPVHRYVFAYKCRNPLRSYDFNYYPITMVMMSATIASMSTEHASSAKDFF